MLAGFLATLKLLAHWKQRFNQATKQINHQDQSLWPTTMSGPHKTSCKISLPSQALYRLLHWEVFYIVLLETMLSSTWRKVVYSYARLFHPDTYKGLTLVHHWWEFVDLHLLKGLTQPGGPEGLRSFNLGFCQVYTAGQLRAENNEACCCLHKQHWPEDPIKDPLTGCPDSVPDKQRFAVSCVGFP